MHLFHISRLAIEQREWRSGESGPDYVIARCIVNRCIEAMYHLQSLGPDVVSKVLIAMPG